MAMGAPLMQALPLLATGARAIGGGMGREGVMPQQAAITPWNPTQDFPLPQKNPMFHDMPPNKPAGGMGAQVVRGQDGPAPRAALVSDRIGPGSSHTKTAAPASNRELGERAGYTTETVQGRAVPFGSSPAPSTGAAPIQAASSDAMPRSVTDIVKQAQPAGKPPAPPPGAGQPPQGAAAMADGGLFGKMMPPPGQKPPLPQKPNFFDGAMETVTGGIGDLQDKLGESSTNPLFQMGMGLLASGYDGSNPYKNILSGMAGVQPALMKQTMADYGIADKEAEAADRQRKKELADALAAIGLKYPGGGEEKKEPPKSRQAASGAKVIRR